MTRRTRPNASRRRDHNALLAETQASMQQVTRVLQYEERIKRNGSRRRLQLSQVAFAREIGLSIPTVRFWEQKRGRAVTATARAFLAVLAQEVVAQAGSEQKLTIKTELRALAQRFEASGENPLHAWHAVLLCTQPDENLVPIPHWTAEYLQTAAIKLLAIVETRDRDDKKIAVAVSNALCITSQGRNAFKNWTGDREKICQKLRFDAAEREGADYDGSLNAANKSGQARSLDSTKKSVLAGKKLLTHIPQRSR